MKTITCCIFFICSISSFAQTLMWSNEVTVANGSVYGDLRPRVAITGNDSAVVVWGGGSSSQPLYTARGNAAGFSSPVTITPNGVDPSIMTWSGADIAARGNTVYCVFKREPEMTNNIYILKSTDGGVTWSDTVRVDQMNGPYDRFPSVAVTPAGNPAVMFMTFDSSWLTPSYVVSNSLDGGATFPMPVNVSTLGSAEVCDCCPGYITVNGTNQAAAWRRNNNNMRDMWTGVSLNSGLSFATGMDADNTNWMLSSCPSSGPSPMLTADSIYTVFMSGASGNNRIYINTHNFLTQQDGYTTLLNGSVPGGTTQNYPFIAGNGDTIAVVWQQLSAGNLDVYYTWSVTGTAGLFFNVAVLNSSVSGSQSNPHVAYSNGTFHFVWTDNSTGNVIYRSASISATGIDEHANADVLDVYPNPSDGQIAVDLTFCNGAAVEIVLSDAEGRTAGEYSVIDQRYFILPKQAAGTYILSVHYGGNVVNSPVIFY